MDPSDIARLLEMFEERYGKKVSGAVMALVMLAVVVWAIHLIFEYFIVPVYDVAQSAARIGVLNEASRWLDAATDWDVLIELSWVVLCYIGFFITVQVVKRRVRKRFTQERIKLESIIDRCFSIAQETETFFNEQKKEAREIIKSAREEVNYATTKLRKLKEIETIINNKGKY